MTTGSRSSSTEPPRVSDREAEVQALLGKGLSNAQIAGRLHISVRTVESHVSSLLRKYAVASRRELAALARPAGRPPDHRLMAGVPPSVTSFVGRTSELEQVLAMVRHGTRLISLLGPGGVGKSRLAAMAVTVAAASFPFGGAFVDLVPVGPDSVNEAVAAALGVTEQPDQALSEVIIDSLGQDRCLLVLDNCEHLMEPVTALIGQMLARCPATTVLTTSRERLAVPGETCLPVDPLPIGSDAVRLFADRAAGVGLVVGGDRAMVAAICGRLDGMPLAIELAAARSAALGTSGLLAALDDSLRLLAGGRDMDQRHRSLRAVMDWSHHLLDPAERALLHRLSVFAGSFDLAAATAVIPEGDLASTADLLGRLADKSLVVRSRNRWRLLEAVRVFAAEQLAASDAAADTAARHLRWAARTAAGLEDILAGGEWQAEFDAVADDLRKALAGTPAAPAELAHALARSLAHLSYARRFVSEARGLFQQAAYRAPAPQLAGYDLANAASLSLIVRRRAEEAFAQLTAAAEQAHTAGDRDLEVAATAQAVISVMRFASGHDLSRTHERLHAMLARAASVADPASPLVSAYLTLARAWYGRGRQADPDPELSATAVAAARAAGDPVLISAALDAQTLVADNAGRHRDVRRFTEERLALLPALPRDEPRAAMEIIDTLTMASRNMIGAGALSTALAAARLAQDEEILGNYPALTASMQILPLTLMGEFTEALRMAAAMWGPTAEIIAGGFVSGWPSLDVLAASLACALTGDQAGAGEWRRRLRQIYEIWTTTPPHDESFAAYVDARLAIAAGQVDGAVVLVERTFADFTYKHHVYYAHSAGAELAVTAGLPQAADLVSDLAADAKESDWAAASYLRAAGRLHGDTDALRAACDAWERIGARYERAVTLLLIPDRAAEGRAELRTFSRA